MDDKMMFITITAVDSTGERVQLEGVTENTTCLRAQRAGLSVASRYFQ